MLLYWSILKVRVKHCDSASLLVRNFAWTWKNYFWVLLLLSLWIDILSSQHISLYQSPEVFCKKSVLKNFANFKGKHLCWSLFLIKLRPQRDSNLGLTQTQRLRPRRHFFTEHLQTAASETWTENENMPALSTYIPVSTT